MSLIIEKPLREVLYAYIFDPFPAELSLTIFHWIEAGIANVISGFRWQKIIVGILTNEKKILERGLEGQGLLEWCLVLKGLKSIYSRSV